MGKKRKNNRGQSKITANASQVADILFEREEEKISPLQEPSIFIMTEAQHNRMVENLREQFLNERNKK